MDMKLLAVCCSIVVVLASLSAEAAVITTLFGPAELEGAAGPGMMGSARVTASIFAVTPKGGVIDFALTNTSSLIQLQPGLFANAFVTELQFDLPDHYVPQYGQCFVIAPVGVRFAQGAGQTVHVTDIERALDWEFGTGTGGGLYARAYEADQETRNNAIFSADALDALGVPVEDYAEGFLKDSWEGGVFDTIIFRVTFENSGPITEGDLPFFTGDHLTVKFQGGEGSAFVPNYAEIVPEPATAALVFCGLAAAVMRGRGRRRRYDCKKE